MIMSEHIVVENLQLNDRPRSGGKSHTLRLRRLGIDTYREAIIYMREDCHVCRSVGFEAQSRILVRHNSDNIITTLNVVKNDLLAPGEAGLSEAAWKLLNAEEGDSVELAHPPPLASLSKVSAKIYGKHLDAEDYKEIITDIAAGSYSDIDLAAFITACAGDQLASDEIISLTRAMIETNKLISWNGSTPIIDKHSIGELPGNRTSMIIVPIVAASGLTMPKIASRGITAPAGTADTMEVFAPVNLSILEMRRVVELEGGCIVCGDALNLSPAEDILIRLVRALNINAKGQLVASVISNKVTTGATHVVIDIPVGTQENAHTFDAASSLGKLLSLVGRAVGLRVQTIFSDGTQPVGRGIGPGLEAKDVLAVLQNETNAPEDLRERALNLAGQVIEMSGAVTEGQGRKIAANILDDGRAWQKFFDICEAQGGFREFTPAAFTKIIVAEKTGLVATIDNRKLSQIAKLAGAPRAKFAGLELFTSIGRNVEIGEPIYTIHAESRTELEYALEFVNNTSGPLNVEEN